MECCGERCPSTFEGPCDCIECTCGHCLHAHDKRRWHRLYLWSAAAAKDYTLVGDDQV